MNWFWRQKKIEKEVKQEKILNWEGLIVRINPRMRAVGVRVDRTRDILVFINGILGIPHLDYYVARNDISFGEPTLMTDDTITVVELANNTRTDVLLREATYNILTIQGDKKILEI